MKRCIGKAHIVISTSHDPSTNKLIEILNQSAYLVAKIYTECGQFVDVSWIENCYLPMFCLNVPNYQYFASVITNNQPIKTIGTPKIPSSEMELVPNIGRYFFLLFRLPSSILARPLLMTSDCLREASMSYS